MIKPTRTTTADNKNSTPSQPKQQRNTKNNKTKNKVIVLRIKEEDKQRLIQLANRADVSVSEFLIRSALNRKLPPAKIDTDAYAALTQLLWEVNKIGNNFNQLTKTCHTSRQLGEPVVVNNNLLQQVDSSLKTVTNTITKAMLKFA